VGCAGRRFARAGEVVRGFAVNSSTVIFLDIAGAGDLYVAFDVCTAGQDQFVQARSYVASDVAGNGQAVAAGGDIPPDRTVEGCVGSAQRQILADFSGRLQVHRLAADRCVAGNFSINTYRLAGQADIAIHFAGDIYGLAGTDDIAMDGAGNVHRLTGTKDVTIYFAVDVYGAAGSEQRFINRLVSPDIDRAAASKAVGARQSRPTQRDGDH